MRLGIVQTSLTLLSAFTVFPPRAGFFHDEIEIPERVTILVIRLSGKLRLSEGRRELVLSQPSISRFDNVRLLTSRIIADSVKNSIEFLSQKWGFLGFCKKTNFRSFSFFRGFSRSKD